MTPQEQAARDAAEAAQRAEAARRQAEAELQRHGQAMSGVSGR
ncbi:hypothetical protein ACFU5O_36625 [Streptomyces sp. NPDC057445]